MLFAVAWCFTAFVATSVLAVDESNELYKTIKQEKGFLMLQMFHRGFIFEKSCKNSCEKHSSVRDIDDCHCDEKCLKFGDCCLDYWESCNASFANAYKQKRIFKCSVPTLSLSLNSTVPDNTDTGYEVVTKCPETFKNLRIKSSCEMPEEANENVLPFVQGIDGRSYRNQFCAECNGVSDIKRWNTTLKCSNETMDLVERRVQVNNYKFTKEERRQIRETCIITMAPPFGVKGTSCKIVTECLDKKNSDYWKCQLYKRQVYSLSKPFYVYKNPHCANCLLTFIGAVSTYNPFSKTEGKHSSLGVLFDFSQSSRIYGLKEITTEETCKPGKIYDHQLKACRTRRISNTLILGNWSCSYSNETFPNSSYYITIYRNRSIYVIAHNKMYKPDEYLWQEGNITVCGNLSVKYLKTTMEKLESLYTKAEFYITVIGLSLSVLALLAVIATYFLFSELRSKLPGKIVINLSVALMLAQTVFLYDMFTDVKGRGCVALAVLLQFLYLAAFCWMNVMAFDVSRTFAGKSHRSPSGSRNKVFLLCLLYAWGVPVFTTGLTLIINHTGTMNVAYGNNYYCWITNPIAMVIFFVVPVVLMLLFNIIALVRVLVAVRQVRKVTKTVRDKSTSGQDARMCWKLTAVFGLTWILCLAAEHHVSLRIIYIIFNSLQGVFIMFGFIITRRVLNMYLKKLGRERLATTTSTGTKRSTLSRSEVTRKTSSAPLVDRKQSKQSEKRRTSPEQAVQVENDEDSPEAQLITSVKGPETRL